MSKNYEMVKNYYDSGFWSKKAVRNAVSKGWITEEECEEILNGNEAEEIGFLNEKEKENEIIEQDL